MFSILSLVISYWLYIFKLPRYTACISIFLPLAVDAMKCKDNLESQRFFSILYKSILLWLTSNTYKESIHSNLGFSWTLSWIWQSHIHSLYISLSGIFCASWYYSLPRVGQSLQSSWNGENHVSFLETRKWKALPSPVLFVPVLIAW